MYVPRLLSSTFAKARRLFPAVLITGPRQAGKTTFLLHEMGDKAGYVSFDDPLERSFAISDPNGFLDRFKDRPVILDEVQYVPELFPYLKIRIDHQRDTKGKWLLTGSQQFGMMKNVSESLAGRIVILGLLPFSLVERRPGSRASLDAAVWNGGYPEPFLFPERRDLWMRSYTQTYIERDVRQVLNVKDLRAFEVFLQLMAARHGQFFNTAVLSREAGITLPTVKAWATLMEASFLCFFLVPYLKNYGKRLVKTPKIYFGDSGLVCALTRQPDAASALSGPLAGALFEGLIVGEAIKTFAAHGKYPDVFFWRSHGGLEVDLIVQMGAKLWPIEIKLTATPTLRHADALNAFKSLAGADAAETGLLVCRVKKETALPGNNIALPWHEFPEWVTGRLSGRRKTREK
jgi:uncharacterized protein